MTGTGVAVFAGLALVAGCSQDSGVNLQNADPTTVVSTTVVSSPALAVPSSSSASAPAGSSPAGSPSPLFSSAADTAAAIAPAEAADRAAAEAQYAKYWEVYAALPHTPEEQWDGLLAPVAVEPMISNAKDDARSIIADGNDTYGTVTHRFSWTGSIDGADTAVLHDCEDGSQAGAYETATGNKITVGVPRQSTMGTLVRGADGTWRLSAAYIVKDTPC